MGGWIDGGEGCLSFRGVYSREGGRRVPTRSLFSLPKRGERSRLMMMVVVRILSSSRNEMVRGNGVNGNGV